jgi:predicted metal-dependent hydrolase
MSQKIVLIPGLGEVLLAKRRGAKNIRLSITARGQVRVGMPTWTPYAAGAAFARSRREWIIKHRASHQEVILKSHDRIGKSFRIYFENSPQSLKTRSRLSQNSIHIVSSLPPEDPEVQQVAQKAGEKALKKEAVVLLPKRLDELAKTHDFSYKEVRIKKLTSRWGSCSNDSVITLSYFLMQLPWPLIDYVLLHELVHTRYLNHSKGFWSLFESLAPDIQQKRKQIHQYKPRIQPSIS